MTTQQKSVTQATKAMNKKGVFTGTIVGGVVGATASLLLAPKGGKELRKDLSEQSKVVVDKSKNLKDQTSNKSKQLLNFCTRRGNKTGEETNKNEVSTQLQGAVTQQNSEETPPTQVNHEVPNNQREDTK